MGDREGKSRQTPREKRRARIQNDLRRYGAEILDSPEMRQAFGQKHHTLSTVGEHSLRVAEVSLSICYALDRLHIATDVPAVVAASLCHDLGILGRDEKYGSSRECSRRHPIDSVAVARRLVEELPEKTEDIIRRHMWPAGRSRAPNSLEAAIVSTADKLAAVEDLVRGYEEKRPGIQGLLREAYRQKGGRKHGK